MSLYKSTDEELISKEESIILGSSNKKMAFESQASQSAMSLWSPNATSTGAKQFEQAMSAEFNMANPKQRGLTVREALKIHAMDKKGGTSLNLDKDEDDYEYLSQFRDSDQVQSTIRTMMDKSQRNQRQTLMLSQSNLDTMYLKKKIITQVFF